jgi:23S rRNA pseudouridine2605 synthase
VRINRYLAACGLGSRRAVEQLVLDGRVAIDGAIVRDLGVQVADGAAITVDGRRASPPTLSRVILFHKPVNVMTTRDDPEGRRTIYDLLPAEFRRFAYAGRLDFASRGLLVLTDDGELLHRLTHPTWDHPKQYLVELDAPLAEADLVRIRDGSIELPDELPLKPVAVRSAGRSLQLELREGRNRQIRRMMEVLGRQVLDLCRVSVGLWSLGALGPGEWRELAPAEIDPMRKLLALPPTGPAPQAAVAQAVANRAALAKPPSRPPHPPRPKPRG